MADKESVLEADAKFDSMIKMEGNYFIMDSEQLVANPFQEMQQEAVSEAQKKNTMTERLTSVKNNVCENHFQMAQRRLERQRMQRLKQLHDHSNKLRHEVKLLDLDRQRHTVEIKKRLMPARDFSYDDTQIVNTERRLGANIASFYLEKKLKYPTRLRSVSDISVTPTIRKARASIRDQQMQRSMDEQLSTAAASRLDRAATAKTTSSSVNANNNNKALSGGIMGRRRDSRSAPAYTRHVRYGGRVGSGKNNDKTSTTTALPAIDQQEGGGGRSREAWRNNGRCQSGNNINNSNSNNNHHHHHHQQSSAATNAQHVKFVFENPLKILASSEESANLFARSHPYYPGMVRAVNVGSETSDDDDDESYLSEVIDLRAILFGGEGGSSAIPGNPQMNLTHQQMAAIRKAQGPAPKLTTDMKQEEANYINSKINTFLENLAMSRMRTRYDSDDSEEELDNGQQQQPQQPVSQVQSKSTSTGMNTASADNNIVITASSSSNTKSTSTADISGGAAEQQQQSFHNDPHKTPTTSNPFKNNSSSSLHGTVAFPNNKEKNSVNFTSNSNININNTKNVGDNEMTEDTDANEGTANNPATREAKYSWRCIRGRDPNGPHHACSSEDLVLQALTGVPISNMLAGHVPLHSASRAMRHTATFKMHKVVEKLIHERTKYERHQVEELKKQMETDGDKQLSGDNQSGRRTSSSSFGARSSRVAAK